MRIIIIKTVLIVIIGVGGIVLTINYLGKSYIVYTLIALLLYGIISWKPSKSDEDNKLDKS
jgi:hypothetical protein